MLGTVRIKLRAHNHCQMLAYPGRFLHAALFSLIGSIDADAAAYWHELPSTKPFTLHLRYDLQRRDRHVQPDDIVWLDINVWHCDLWHILEHIPSVGNMQIGPLSADIVNVQYEAPFGLPLAPDNIMDFINLHLEGPLPQRITLECLAPTSFHGMYGDITFPTAELIFASLVDKWNVGDGEHSLDKERIKALCERIILTEWNGRSQRVFFGRDRGLTGFVGKYTFILASLTDEERQLISILAMFGEHAGVGRLSSHGLGRIRITEHTDKKRSKSV